MDLRIGWVLAFVLLTVTGCGRETSAQRHVRAMLKDPDSAKFELLFTGRNNLECGTVNAKNSFGGYTGAQAYMQYQESVGIAENESQSMALATCCAFLRPLVAGDVPWSKPGFGTACSGLPQSGWDFTKPLE